MPWSIGEAPPGLAASSSARGVGNMNWTIAIGTGLLLWITLLALGGWANRDSEASWQQRQRRQYRGRHRAW